MLKEGDAAPDFAISDQSGKQRSLKDYAGQNLLLWWYPKADTPG